MPKQKLFMVGDPADVSRRTWAIGMGLPALHARACECLRWRKDTSITGVTFVASSIAIDPPVTLFGVVSDVLDPVRKSGRPLLRSRAVELLERLTIDLSVRIVLPGPSQSSQPDARAAAARPRALAVEVRVDRALSTEDRRLSDFMPGDTFATRWEKWCLESGHPLLALLDEYEFVKGQLDTLTRGGARLWDVLSRLVGTGSRLSLGSWSCELPRGWKHQCDPFWAPSQWTEFLLAKKHGTNTREVKQRLRDARVERQIQDAWAAYGDWLLEHEEALRELEALLGVPITRGVEGHELVHETHPQKVTRRNQ